VRKLLWILVFLGVVAVGRSRAATIAASYRFHDSLAAEEPGMPALLSVDPVGTNQFRDSVVFGQSRRVFYFGGNASPPTQQGGLTLKFPAVVPTNDYSLELVFRFHTRAGGWRRIVDVQNRVSDQGFYVDPGNTLDVYPVSGSTSNFVNNVYHHVVLTVASDATIRAYLDGTPQFVIHGSTQMYVANPAGVLHLFLDNLQAGGQGEYSPGEISLFRVHSGVLAPADVGLLAGLEMLRIRIEPRGATAAVSWTSSATGFHLEYNSSFENAPGWVPIAGTPQPVGDRLEWVEPVSEGRRFYRLAQ
jgi:hypothetical protein